MCSCHSLNKNKNELASLDLSFMYIIQKLRGGEQTTHQIQVPFPVSNAPLSFSSLSLLLFQDLGCQNVFWVDFVLKNDYEEGNVKRN